MLTQWFIIILQVRIYMRTRTKVSLLFVSCLAALVYVITIKLKVNTNISAQQSVHDQLKFPNKNMNDPAKKMALCNPDKLGNVSPNLTEIKLKDVDNIVLSAYPGRIGIGGHSIPLDCYSPVKVAIIVPYRNRTTQLAMFLRHIHPILLKQKLEYQIFVIDQIDNLPFNRATLFNTGFNITIKREDFNCFIFHDVDLLIENENGMYNCPKSPFHMGRFVDDNNYKPYYDDCVGGVIAFSLNDYQRINGHSNCYWGWGGEDDDVLIRLKKLGITIHKASDNEYRYTMNKVKHLRNNSEPSKIRHMMLKSAATRIQYDGLSNLNYNIILYQEKLLYTHIKVNLTDQKTMSTCKTCKCEPKKI